MSEPSHGGPLGPVSGIKPACPRDIAAAAEALASAGLAVSVTGSTIRATDPEIARFTDPYEIERAGPKLWHVSHCGVPVGATAAPMSIEAAIAAIREIRKGVRSGTADEPDDGV